MPPRRAEVVEELDRREMLPAIYFLFSRAGCDEAVDQCRAAGLRLTSDDEAARIREIAQRHVEGLSDADLDVLGWGRWMGALEAGLASHHAGMVPPMKEAVEEAFTAGLVKAVFATETLALGINMPARTVVLERLTKFTGERHENLTPGQYTQLTGRAGRRGIDEVGYAVVLWNRWVPFSRVAGLASTRTYELTSAFRPTYNMAANLVANHSRREAFHLLSLSFAQYRADRDVVAAERRATELEEQLGEARAELACELGDVAEYERRWRALQDARRHGSRRHEVEAALARLRPGEVVHAGGRVGRVVVLSRSTGRGGGAWVSALSERGKTVRLSASSFRAAPEPLARIRLPEPFRPKHQGFRKEVVKRLRRAPARPGRRRQAPDAVSEAQRVLDRHPVAQCPDREEHLRRAQAARRLERDLDRLERRRRRRSDTLARRFERILEVLERRGYSEGWALSEWGEVLRGVSTEADLLITESIRAGLLDGLSPEELAATVSCFTWEYRGPPESAPPVHWPTSEVASRVRGVEHRWRELVGDERELALDETRAPDAGLADAVFRWARGEPLDEVLDEDLLTGGDFVRSIRQLIDLLGQLGQAAPGAALAAACREASGMLRRGVVEASTRVRV